MMLELLKRIKVLGSMESDLGHTNVYLRESHTFDAIHQSRLTGVICSKSNMCILTIRTQKEQGERLLPGPMFNKFLSQLCMLESYTCNSAVSYLYHASLAWSA